MMSPEPERWRLGVAACALTAACAAPPTDAETTRPQPLAVTAAELAKLRSAMVVYHDCTTNPSCVDQWDTGGEPALLAADLPRMQDLGLNAVWSDIWWDRYASIEPDGAGGFRNHFNEGAFSQLRAEIAALRSHGMKMILPLNYVVGRTIAGLAQVAPADADYAHGCSRYLADPTQYALFRAYINGVLTRLAPDADALYILFFTELAEPTRWSAAAGKCVPDSAYPDANAIATLIRGTLGRLPLDVRDTSSGAPLRGTFRFGYHDYSLVTWNQAATTPIEPGAYDFYSIAVYPEWQWPEGYQTYSDGRAPTLTTLGHDWQLVNPGLVARGSKGAVPPNLMLTDLIAGTTHGVAANTRGLRDVLDQALANVTARLPGMPVLLGETGVSQCVEDHNGRDDIELMTAVPAQWAIDHGLGFNLWNWDPAPGSASSSRCAYAGMSLVRDDRSLRRGAVALRQILRGAPRSVPTTWTQTTNLVTPARVSAVIASSELGGFPAGSVVTSDRRGSQWGAGGGWNDATPNAFADQLELTFRAPVRMRQVNLFTLQDAFWSAGEPVLGGSPATQFGVRGVQLYAHDPMTGAWTTAGPPVTNNTQAWIQIDFPERVVDGLRVVVTDAAQDPFTSARYSRIVKVEAVGAYGDTNPADVNLALFSRGTIAVSQDPGLLYQGSAYFPLKSLIDGERSDRFWANDGGWNSATSVDAAHPIAITLDLGGAHAIDEVDLFTVRDGYGAPTPPMPPDLFTAYGVTDFDVEALVNGQWVHVTGSPVTGNHQVWAPLRFSPIMTSQIRVTVRGVSGIYARITELEVWGTP